MQILRPIQRYGREGRRSGNGEADTEEGKDQTKDPRFLWLSFDEATSHVNVKYFRLLLGAYDQSGQARPPQLRLPAQPVLPLVCLASFLPPIQLYSRSRPCLSQRIASLIKPALGIWG